MEAAEEKQKIRQEILAKGKVVAIPDVFQVRVTFFVFRVSVRVRKGMYSQNISVHYREGGCSVSFFFFPPQS